MTQFTKIGLVGVAIGVVTVFGILAQSSFESQGRKIGLLETRLLEVEKELAARTTTKREVVRREIIREKSQEELLTSAVEVVAPAVVSVVVTKDVPQFEVVFENPFGDDPFFRDFGTRIPRFEQRGVERQKVGAGSGFIIRNDGYVVTNRHVVDDPDAFYTVLLSDGRQIQAEVVYKDPSVDLAILKVPGGGFPTVRLGNSDALKLGQSVFAVGNALGEFSNSVSVGIVSGLGRNLQATGLSGNVVTLDKVVQTDAAINPGNSGGPLVNLQGEVIGVNVAMARGSENIGFSIPINVVKGIIQAALGYSA